MCWWQMWMLVTDLAVLTIGHGHQYFPVLTTTVELNSKFCHQHPTIVNKTTMSSTSLQLIILLAIPHHSPGS